MTRVTLVGAKGRMGVAIQRVANALPQVSLAWLVDAGDPFEQPVAECDVVIEFSHHTVTPSIAKLCADLKRPLVIGTTGHTDEERHTVAEAANKVPVVFAPNFSVGVNTLFALVAQAVRILGEDFDLEVVEMHHRHKQDAPSGTAKRLVEILAQARNLSYDEHVRHGREGLLGARTQKEIGVHARRGGDVVGDHTVIFAADGERLEVTHKASSRETFARGALRAALWVTARDPGLYDMQDVLGLGR
ncbi:MAG: 4-hydroxy-tetrahydrodipicolinate reductase [Verrucomicrobiia bacterium]